MFPEMFTIRVQYVQILILSNCTGESTPVRKETEKLTRPCDTAKGVAYYAIRIRREINARDKKRTLNPQTHFFPLFLRQSLEFLTKKLTLYYEYPSFFSYKTLNIAQF